MKPNAKPPTLLRWLKWPAICLLFSVWAVVVTLGALLGWHAQAARLGAEWIVKRLDDLNES